MSDSLLQRVASGETDAVTACIDRFGGLVWTLARRILSQPAEAEDAVQEVFVELWKSAPKFDPSIAAETTFVAMIARRRLIDIRRRLSRRADSDFASVEELPIEAPQETDQVEIRDEAAQAKAAMGQLRPEQRRVLQLAVCQGWPHQLIADKLGLPLGTVKTHIRRGLIKIREVLDAHLGRSGGGVA